MAVRLLEGVPASRLPLHDIKVDCGRETGWLQWTGCSSSSETYPNPLDVRPRFMSKYLAIYFCTCATIQVIACMTYLHQIS
jgi:hypothetical protein